MQFIYYSRSRCMTCQKAKKWLPDTGITVYN